jgi:6,7-dimethyl-8-ribityllumazine synthase
MNGHGEGVRMGFGERCCAGRGERSTDPERQVWAGRPVACSLEGEVVMQDQVKCVYEGKLLAEGLRFGIVCSRFNEFFVSKLLEGALDCLRRHGADLAEVEVAWVPGSFEVPFVSQKLAESRRYDAVIALGVVIQGATAHAQFINGEVAKGLAQASSRTGIPVIYGVVTTESIEQAIERSGTKAGNRGASAAATAIEMANLMKQLPEAQ